MGDLIYDNSRFIFREGGREKVLLDCMNVMSNKSRIPMHRLEGQETMTIPAFVDGLMEKESVNPDDMRGLTALLDVLLAARLVQTSQPVRVLEYGCLGGRISWHLAQVLGAFHKESSLVCACDRMDEAWLRQMETVEEPPQISFLAGDYGRMPLAPGSFDLVFINGTADFADPEAVILDAGELASRDGLLMCCSSDTPFLRDLFRLYYEKEYRTDYEIDPFRMLMTARASDRRFRSWQETEYAEYGSLLQEHLKQAEAFRTGRCTDPERRAALEKQLLADAKKAALRGDVKQKLRLMEVRENLRCG